jgi:hypothetical protein
LAFIIIIMTIIIIINTAAEAAIEAAKEVKAVPPAGLDALLAKVKSRRRNVEI